MTLGQMRLAPRRFSIRNLPRNTVPALFAGLLLRAYFLMVFAHVAGDSLVYGDIAHNLLQHHVYGFTNGPGSPVPVRSTLIRLPGYPFFLAACFVIFGLDHYMPVLILQVVIDLASCVLLSRLAARLFGERAGHAALWLAVLCPFTANYTAAPLTETLTLFAITVAFYALARWMQEQRSTSRALNGWLYLLAGALAYAILLRPEQGMLAAAVVPAVLLVSLRADGWHLRSFRAAAVLSLLTLLPLVPWTLRNLHTFHVFQPLAPRYANDPGEQNPAGFQRWYRTWAVDFASTDSVYWNYDGNAIAVADLPNRAFDSQAQYAQTAALLDTYNQNNVATPALDQAFGSIAQQRIAADPTRYYLALPAARVLNMAFRPRTDMLPVPTTWWRFRDHRKASFFAIIYAALNLAYFLLATFALVRRRDSWRRHTVIIYSMLATIALRCALLLTLDNSEPRYTLEFFPVLIVLAAAVFAVPVSTSDTPLP